MRTARAFARRTAACEMRWLIWSCAGVNATWVASTRTGGWISTGRGRARVGASRGPVRSIPMPGATSRGPIEPPQRSRSMRPASSHSRMPLARRTAACEMRWLVMSWPTVSFTFFGFDRVTGGRLGTTAQSGLITAGVVGRVVVFVFVGVVGVVGVVGCCPGSGGRPQAGGFSAG